ncbi:MAG: M50 family metallopeptidase [Anaerolineaceae bacterium]|jgi:regulator of sigma E protease
MSSIWLIVQFIIMFGLLIFFHELGHFLSAKLLGIEVLEFGFGYPPRLFKLFTWKGTDVTINAIPFGGFVRPKGETDITEPGSILAAPAWKRLIVLISGALMNFLVGIILLIVMYSVIGAPAPDKVLVTRVLPHSAAEKAALHQGDHILTFNNEKVASTDHLSQLIAEHKGEQVTLGINRAGTPQDLPVTLVANPRPGEYALGIEMSVVLEPQPLSKAVGSAFQAFAYQTRETIMLPVRLIRGTAQPGEARIVGIKGIYDLFNQANTLDATSPAAASTPLPLFRMSMASGLSIALGITNLLPIPALDGGQIIMTLPEILFKKRIPQKTINAINSVFFFLLIALMIYITFQDFLNPVIQP